eukprot:scaffold1526_cov126-Skeletonema_dohrnii-CCMP3373.AAC.6
MSQEMAANFTFKHYNLSNAVNMAMNSFFRYSAVGDLMRSNMGVFEVFWSSNNHTVALALVLLIRLHQRSMLVCGRSTMTLTLLLPLLLFGCGLVQVKSLELYTTLLATDNVEKCCRILTFSAEANLLAWELCEDIQETSEKEKDILCRKDVLWGQAGLAAY